MNKTTTWLLVGVSVLSSGCATPVSGLWPPEPGTPSHAIIVSVDTWHAMIALPAKSVAEGRPTEQKYEEWGYAEEAWYLEGRQGISGILRALFWPSAGVVEIGHYDQVWSERTPQPPAEKFTFHLTDEGFARLRDFLRSTIAAPTPIVEAGGSRFFPGSPSYHVFHQCHHYSARALREAGLPVSVFWALTRRMFSAQLRRAEGMAAEGEEASQERGSPASYSHTPAMGRWHLGQAEPFRRFSISVKPVRRITTS